MGRNKRPVPARLASKLYAIRLQLGYSQTELFKLICAHLADGQNNYRSIISEYELGLRQPSLVETLAYARLVNVSTDVLIDDSQDLPFA